MEFDKSSIGKIDFSWGLEKELYLPGQAKLRKSVKTAGSHRLLVKVTAWTVRKNIVAEELKEYFDKMTESIYHSYEDLDQIKHY